MNETRPLYEEESLMQRIKDSPRTVSALIIILIVAAAIYAFSGEKNQGASSDQVTEQAAQEEKTVTEPAGAKAVTGEGETADQTAGQVAAETDEVKAPAVTNLPEARKTNEGYIEVAQRGDGYTHLARRATTKWLSENQASYSVTDEHRIFIEDYIQNRIGSEGMEIGQEHLINWQLMEEAVSAAGELTEGQLNNLSQYTVVLD